MVAFHSAPQHDVFHFIGPTPYTAIEKWMIKHGWRQEYLRPHDSRSTVRKLVRMTARSRYKPNRGR